MPTAPRLYTQACLPAGHEGATGPRLVALIRRVFGAALPTWVSVSDADISGDVRTSAFVGSTDARTFASAAYLELLERAEQVVWITLFFCTSADAAKSISGTEDYSTALAKADALVRVVDAGHYYVYLPWDGTAAIAPALERAELKRGAVDLLDFPE